MINFLTGLFIENSPDLAVLKVSAYHLILVFGESSLRRPSQEIYRAIALEF